MVFTIIIENEGLRANFTDESLGYLDFMDRRT